MVAAGLFTFIVALGVVTRLAQVTRTANFLHRYENCFVAGGIIGNLYWIFQWPVGLKSIGLLIIGVFGGIFTGCLIGSIAEILNAFPIFFRRLNLKYGITAVILGLALGKFVGVILQYFFS